MVSRTSSLMEFKELTRLCLDEFYTHDFYLLERNFGKGVGERAIVFRFSHYLQLRTRPYFVDCDYNSSLEFWTDSHGRVHGEERHGKVIVDSDGRPRKRFVDIIVHQRDYQSDNDLICFEFKKWNNAKRDEIKKDRNNLRVLTSQYGYFYGFHVVIHRQKSKSKWTIFQNGVPIEENRLIFENEAQN